MNLSIRALLLLCFISGAASAQTADDDAIAETTPENTTKTAPATTVKTWEAGIGIGAISGPDYRGSKEYSHYVAPIPYFIYRGKYIQTDRDGVRGKLFTREDIELNLSMSASITPESDENKLREGMPELYSTVEFGPALNINLTGDTFRDGWMMHLPLRGVVAVGGGDADYVGWLVHPQLAFRTQIEKWNFSFRTGVYYASDDYHDHYYTVAEEYATASRPVFEADAGYSGWSNSWALSRAFDDYRIAFFIRYDNLRGAEFEDSPLVETTDSVAGGLALIWVIH